MKLHKDNFYIRMNDGYEKDFGTCVKVVNGYISEDGAYGFHREGSRWIGTDILSGRKICQKTTRKGCIEQIDELVYEIQKATSVQSYFGDVDFFKAAIENFEKNKNLS